MSKISDFIAAKSFADTFDAKNKYFTSPLSVKVIEYNKKDQIYDVKLQSCVKKTPGLHIVNLDCFSDYEEIPFRIKVMYNAPCDFIMGNGKPVYLKSLKNFPNKIKKLEILECPNLESFGNVEEIEVLFLSFTNCKKHKINNLNNIPKVKNLLISKHALDSIQNVDGIIGKVEFVEYDYIWYKAEEFVLCFNAFRKGEGLL